MGEGVPLADIGRVPPQFKSNLDAAHAAMRLTPQERALYERHVSNLFGPGGVDNPDGSRSTLYQLSFESGGKTYNVPTVYDGKILKPDAAIDAAFAQGLNNFPSYPDQAAAEQRYQQMHSFMEGDTAQYLAQRKGGLNGLASSDGVPLSDIGRNIPPPQPQADLNGPIDPEVVKQYLARTGQIYPPLFSVNPEAWTGALAQMPESLNIEDRRGINRKR